MTALKEYERLEATGLWRPGPEEQRREVIVSIGDATLVISDLQDRALTHWSLAALVRQNPGELPARYSPDGDPGETLEFDADESAMIDAVERLRRAVERSRAHPGRLRFLGAGLSILAVLALAVFWLPVAMISYSVSVVPDITRGEIGRALLGRIERLAGSTCVNSHSRSALAALAKRTGVAHVVVVPGGIRDTLHLPGGFFVLNKTLIEDHEDPAVPAGYILAERVRAQDTDPLFDLLEYAGTSAAFRLITTGQISEEVLDAYAEHLATETPTRPDTDALLAEFGRFSLTSKPYAYARDITGETTLNLIEGDPTTGATSDTVLPDGTWLRLQSICGG